jgi:hypothetical protein
MACGCGSLDLVDEAGDGINGVVFGSGPKLGHREEVVSFNVGIDSFGDDFFEEFAGAFEEGDRVVGLGDGVVRLLWLIDHNDHGGFPWMVS